MKKEILAPGNRVLGADREIIIKELHDRELIDTENTSWSYETLDGILITPESLRVDGYSPRTITTPEGTITDFVKLITISDTVFFTLSVRKLAPGEWRLTILDSNHNGICSGNVYFWHTLQNLISAYVLS